MNLNSTRRNGFTILEVLIALTASLLLMLGLARAYKLLGDKITERQSELDLSSRLRDVAIRLRDELEHATCSMSPPASESASEGYFVYHEGPFTESTTILGSVQHPTPRDLSFFPDSEYGDIDDYIAFTSRAREGAPFNGFIPKGVLDAQRLANGQMTAAELAAYTSAESRTLVPFYSDFAEIAYWLSPEWERNADGSLLYDNQNPDGGGQTSLYPLYRDRNGDMLPDKLTLHRRVLLIRPDLNMTLSEINELNTVTLGGAAIPGVWTGGTVPFFTRDGGGNLRVLPISDLNGATQSYFPNDNGNTIVAPGVWPGVGVTARDSAAPQWLAGLARMQQVMDLSLARVTDDWSVPLSTLPSSPTTSTYGMPTALVRANNLATLSRPENRFAHVRIPHSIISGSAGSSMPLLALSPPHPYLLARSVTPPNLPDPNDPLVTGNTCTTFPTQADHVSSQAPPGATAYLTDYGRFTMKTFLRPEFNLADRVSDFGAGGSNITTVNRGGSDIIAHDVVGFNIQIFDPQAPRFVWTGDDGEPGRASFDDDGNGLGATVATSPDLFELGWDNSDDEAVSVNEPRVDQVLVNDGFRTFADWNDPTDPDPFFLVDRGDFVDLGYMRLAGGPMRGLIQFDESGNIIASPGVGPSVGVPPRYAEFSSPFSGFSSQFSGIYRPTGVGTPLYSAYPSSWEQSGRFVLSTRNGAGALSSFYQPTYDTWTDGYERDVFDQEGVAFGASLGVPFAIETGGNSTGVPFYTERRVAQNNPTSISANPLPVMSRRWSSFSGTLSNEGEFAGQSAGQQQAVASHSITPVPATPPVPEPMRAIKITIRLNDVSAETIRQQTVIQEF